MHQNEKDSLTALLNQTRDIFQNMSRSIHWSAADSELLDDLANGKDLKADISNRIAKISRSRISDGMVPSFLLYKAWQRTKAVYAFNRELIRDMMQTEDTSLYVSLLERLPFRDMLFYFPEGMFPKLKDEETAGIFVHIEKHPELLCAFFHFYDRKQDDPSQIYPGLISELTITNGMKVSQIFETPQFLEWLSTYKLIAAYDHHLNEQETEERILAEKKALNATINLLYYLSSKDADIKPIKRHKKSQKPSSKMKDNNPAINLHEVGYTYAEIVYRTLSLSNDNDEQDVAPDDHNEDKSNSVQAKKHGKKKRPHVRKAHFQYYWTGEGRTTPILRWKSDLFIGANRDDQATIVYDVKKESLKGKRNPNTSKKKREK